MFSHLAALLFFLGSAQSSSLLQKGLLELSQGSLQSARTDLENASKLDSLNPYVWTALAEVYVRTNDPSLAASAAAHAEKAAGNNPMLAHALALYYANSHQFAKAAKHEEVYAASAPSDESAKGRIALWYLAADDDLKAIAPAKVAARSDKTLAFQLSQSFLRHQQFTDAADVVNAGLEVFPSDPQLELALGVARYGQRRFEDAITIFLKVIAIDPQIEQPYQFLSRMLDQAGPHLSKIVKDTEVWAKQNPNNAEAQLDLAKALLAQEPADATATSLLLHSVELDPTRWEAHFQLGLQLVKIRDYSAASSELQKAVALDPKQAMPHYHLARVYDRLGDAQAAAREREIHKQLVDAGAQ